MFVFMFVFVFVFVFVCVCPQGVYDVTSTSMKAPECVVSEVERVLSEMGIEFKRKK